MLSPLIKKLFLKRIRGVIFIYIKQYNHPAYGVVEFDKKNKIKKK